jgi:hypothetical protein
MERIKLKRPNLSRADFDRRADEFLKVIQKELMPEHASEFVAINMETGDYVLGKTPGDASEAFWDKWPDVLMYKCRVDGGPAYKFHGKRR